MKQLLKLSEPLNKVSCSKDLFNKIDNVYIDYKQEHLILFCLNTKNQVVHEEVVFKGGLDSCVIDPRTIFRIALEHNASNIIIAHNHSSGNLQPSTEDKNVFDKLKQAGEILRLKCLDSIIFNEKEFYSMVEA